MSETPVITLILKPSNFGDWHCLVHNKGPLIIDKNRAEIAAELRKIADMVDRGQWPFWAPDDIPQDGWKNEYQQHPIIDDEQDG